VKRSVIVLMSLAAFAGVAQAAAPPAVTGKIGVVNTQRLLGESPQVRAAREALQAEFAPEDRAIQTLAQTIRAKEEKYSKDAQTMTAQARSTAEREITDGYTDLQARQKKLEDNLKVRSEEEDQKLQRVVLEEVQKYARENGFDLIVSAGVLFANPALDITAPVLQALQARAPAPAAAPAAPVKP
jgi:outer membrane protein